MIGLGLMGTALTERLLEHGYGVAVWNRTREKAAPLLARGVQYLDAPISGSSEQTRRGEATVIVGGDRTVFDACADLWAVLGRNVFLVGSCGGAARMKLTSNLVLGLNRAVLAEGLAFTETHGRLLEQAEAAGLGELDNSAIQEVLRLPGRRRAS